MIITSRIKLKLSGSRTLSFFVRLVSNSDILISSMETKVLLGLYIYL